MRSAGHQTAALHAARALKTALFPCEGICYVLFIVNFYRCYSFNKFHLSMIHQ